jgi:hypothetical protein
MKVVPGTKCFQKFFQNFFRSKNKVFGPVQMPKKVILFGFSTGTKDEFRLFED